MQTRSIQTYQGQPAKTSREREAPYLQLRPPLRIHGGLLVVTFIMVCFGLVMLFSASMSDSFNANSGNSMYYIIKQGSITLIGLILALILAVLIPVSFFDRPIITLHNLPADDRTAGLCQILRCDRQRCQTLDPDRTFEYPAF